MKIKLDFKILKYLLSLVPNLSYNSNKRELENSAGTNAILPYASSGAAGLLQRNFRASFLPTLKDAGGGATYSFTNGGSVFERMGNLVFFQVLLKNVNQTGTPSGALYIGNLPFVINNSVSIPFTIGGFTGGNKRFYNLIARSRGINVSNFKANDIVFEYSDTLTGSIGQGTNKRMEAVSFTNGFISVSGWYPIPSGSPDFII